MTTQKIIKNAFLTILVFSFFNTSAQTGTDPNLGIIPAPVSVKKTAGQFKLSSETIIVYSTDEDKNIAQLFKEALFHNVGLNLSTGKQQQKTAKNTILFSSAQTQDYKPESYTINANANQITVKGNKSGLFYGMQSLLQIINTTKESLFIEGFELEDYPRYSYRGLHLDVSRHFFPISFIKKYIDLMAMYKLNNFHWHLTDDQGWRLEIKKYPKLTEIGGYRARTMIGNYRGDDSQAYDGERYGGFYTQAEAREIVKYAASKYINVIPEIEMPGHALSILAAYPEFANEAGAYKVAEKWGVFDEILSPEDKTFTFLENVLNEVMIIFPSKYIHIGGDEVPKVHWKRSAYAQKLIKKLKLKDENELQSYFIQRVEKFLNTNGRQIIGWDEILEGGLAPNATVMSWRGTEGGIIAANQKHNVIMTPGSEGLYFDHAQGRSDQEPLSIGGYSPLNKSYQYNPTPPNLSPELQKYIIGVQANLWTEYIETPQKVEYMILPRLLSLAEISWSQLEKKDFTNFERNRLPYHLSNLDARGFNYRVPTAFGAQDGETILAEETTFLLEPSVKGAKIYYTIDGYTPAETEKNYGKPFTVKVPKTSKRLLKTIVISPSGKRSAITNTWIINREALNPEVAKDVKDGLKYRLYKGTFASTADFEQANIRDSGFIKEPSIAGLQPKIKEFGVLFDGYIKIEKDGVYDFSTNSDDGSKLWIGGEVVVDNDKKHNSFENSGRILLKAGLHKLKIAYFNIGGNANLKVFMKAPGGLKETIPASILKN